MLTLDLSAIKNKLRQAGARGLVAAALRRAAQLIEPECKVGYTYTYSKHQLSAHSVLSRYTSFIGKDILEVGGSQCCESMQPFLKDGAGSGTVTGLDHISEEKVSDVYNLRVMRADALAMSDIFGSSRFDIVYGLSVVEHIVSPSDFLEQVYAVLKPGGLAYFEGNPIWSSPRGHHLWVSTADGAYRDRTTANYYFSNWLQTKSTNPLPDWSHLLMKPDQMRGYLSRQAIPEVDVDCIVDWVFCSDSINRMSMAEIAEAYSSSKLVILEANTSKVAVAQDMQDILRQRCGDAVDYGICGVTYVMRKPI